ncbi:MAG: DNA polymerase III subunit delta [Caulobacterales bacterium]|nr:DNA polymerase III subunit delta [Caulobacterales bacterium]
MVALKKIDEALRELKSPNPARCFMVYGPDSGICEQHIIEASRIYKAHFPNCDINRFSEDDINRDFASFENSVCAASLFGNSSIAIIRLRNDSISSKLSALLSDIDANKIELSGAILIFSSSINNKSKLVQAFEKSDNALIIRLFDPTKLELINIIKAKALSENVSINKDAIDAILNDTVNDSNSLIAQMENLALYVGKGNEIGLDAIEALNVNNRESGIDEMVNALFVGNSKVCLIASNRLLKTGSAIIPMINALMRRCLLLNNIYSEVANGRTATEIVKDKRSGIFWKDQDIIIRQANIWNRKAIERALHEIILADAKCKTTNLPQEEIFERLIMRLSEYSKSLSSRN